MADKPEFIDLIGQATRQNWRRAASRADLEPEVKDKRRLSHWPPERFEQWRLENLTPWKLRSWKYRDWN